MKLTAIILASTIATAPPALEPQRYTLSPARPFSARLRAAAWCSTSPGLEQALSAAHAAGAREKCGRAI